MSTYREDILRVRFEAAAAEPIAADWLDVRRRARDRHRRTLVLATIAAALVIVLVGCTAVIGPRVIRFDDAEPSPPEAVDWLQAVRHAGSITDPGAPGFDPTETRRLLDGPFRGGTLAIDLTPAEGGFCVSLDYVLPLGSGDSTECVTVRQERAEPVAAREIEGRVIESPRSRQAGATSIIGWTAIPDAASAVVQFEDGTTIPVDRFVRVTAPIDASFYTVEIPTRLSHFPRRASAVIVRDADGSPLARARLSYGDPDAWTFPRFAKGNQGFPPAADASRSVLLRFPGTTATVRVAPAVGGITCFRFTVPGHGGADNCLRDRDALANTRLGPRSFFPSPGAGPVHPVVLWGFVGPSVASVDLRFQDGTHTTAHPQRGFVVFEIPTGHFDTGKRLVGARLLDDDDRLVRMITFDSATRDLYPCDDPVDPGLGPLVCP